MHYRKKNGERWDHLVEFNKSFYHFFKEIYIHLYIYVHSFYKIKFFKMLQSTWRYKSFNPVHTFKQESCPCMSCKDYRPLLVDEWRAGRLAAPRASTIHTCESCDPHSRELSQFCVNGTAGTLSSRLSTDRIHGTVNRNIMLRIYRED